jgi:hypothetical protein
VKYALLVFLSFQIALANAQTTFQRYYYNDLPGFVAEMRAVTVTSDGGILMVGKNYTTLYSGCLFIVKTDSLGNVQWANHYDSLSNFVVAIAVIETQDHGFAITGHLESPVSFDPNAFILRLNDTGKVIFARRYEASDEVGNALVETADKNLIVVGTTTLGTMSVIKTDSNGVVAWKRIYEDANDPILNYGASAITLRKDGNIVLAGGVGGGSAFADMTLLMLDSTGDFIWGKSYGGTYDESLWTFAPCADGGFLLGGSSKSFTSNHTVKSGLLIKTDSVGNLLWTKHLPYPDIQQVRCVQETHDHNIILTDAAMNLIGLDQNGNFLWAKHYGNIGGTSWLVSESKNSNGYWLAMSTGFPTTPPTPDYYLVRTDDSGNSLCYTYSLNPSVMDTVVLTHTITLVANSGIDTSSYFSVYESNAGKDSTLCYGVINTVQNLSIEHFSIFPNPTTGLVTIQAPLPIELVEISNAFGEKVFSAQPQSPNTTINLQSLPKGIYFYSVKTKSRTERGKVVLQ